MLVKPPYLIRKFFPQLLWEVQTTKKEIFLTFDDGPHPEITPLILDLLDEYKAKATFFCVGENVKKYPETYALIPERGHYTGNHSFNHLNGWKTNNSAYFENIEKASSLIASSLFRPPYGRITPSQISALKSQYKIVMWTVATYDFSKKVSPEQCRENAIQKSKAGSIVVFHDSEKARDNILFALPAFLEHYQNKGFTFPLIPQ